MPTTSCEWRTSTTTRSAGLTMPAGRSPRSMPSWPTSAPPTPGSSTVPTSTRSPISPARSSTTGFKPCVPSIFAWVEASLEVVAPDDPRRANFLDAACFGRWQIGDVDGAWAALREGLALAEPGTRAHRGLIAAHMNLEGRAGNLDVAIPLAIESAALATAAGDTVWFAVERFQELLFRCAGGRRIGRRGGRALDGRRPIRGQSDRLVLGPLRRRRSAGRGRSRTRPPSHRRRPRASPRQAAAGSSRVSPASRRRRSRPATETHVVPLSRIASCSSCGNSAHSGRSA